jgi:hypothetical protein
VGRDRAAIAEAIRQNADTSSGNGVHRQGRRKEGVERTLNVVEAVQWRGAIAVLGWALSMRKHHDSCLRVNRHRLGTLHVSEKRECECQKACENTPAPTPSGPSLWDCISSLHRHTGLTCNAYFYPIGSHYSIAQSSALICIKPASPPALTISEIGPRPRRFKT